MDWARGSIAIVGLVGALAAVPVRAEYGLPGEAPDPTRLVVGRVSADPRSSFPRLAAFASALASRLGDFGIASGTAIVARSNDDMIRLLREGKVDLISETPYSAFQFVDARVAEILLLEKRRGAVDFRTIFFRRADAKLDSLAGLPGRKVGFEDPGSTSGFFLPFMAMRDFGLALVPLASPRGDVPSDQVGYVFLRGEINIAAATVAGIVDAGVANDRDWEIAQGMAPARGQLVSFHVTEAVPRSLLLVRQGIGSGLKEKIRQLLLDGPMDDREPQAFKLYQDAGGFQEIDPETWKKLGNLRVQSKKVREAVTQ